MIPAAFDYRSPRTLDEAVGLLAEHGEEAKVLAGGHSLIPAMKLRLAQPAMLVDLGRVADLAYVRTSGNGLAIGAMTTHHELETAAAVAEHCPLLARVASQIGDAQVRNKGTIGGSLVHADPAGDWPAAILALEAELEIAGPNGRRTVAAADFFVDMLETAVQPNEILCEIRVPETTSSVAYAKFAQKASGFALAGAAVVIDVAAQRVRVGISGVAPMPYRASGVEQALLGLKLGARAIADAAAHAADGVDALGDIHASAEFRCHLAQVQTQRALTEASS